MLFRELFLSHLQHNNDNAHKLCFTSSHNWFLDNYPPPRKIPQGQLPLGNYPPPPENYHPPPRTTTPQGQLPPGELPPPMTTTPRRQLTPEDNYPRGHNRRCHTEAKNPDFSYPLNCCLSLIIPLQIL